MATPPLFMGGSQSSLTKTLSVVVEITVYCKFIGGEGEPR